MAKAEVIEMAILPQAISSAMIRLFSIIVPTGGVPLVDTPASSIRA
jgi:hypothetical protein